MPRRSLITAVTVVVVLGLIVLVPAVPLVRDAIVDRVLRLLGGSGISVAYSGSSGNPWRGIELSGTSVQAPGLDVEVSRLRLGYFLPSLLGGELPIDVALSGVSGDVDLQELLDTLARPTGGGGGVSVRLRQIALDDVSVNAERLPFTLPDLSIDSLRLEQQTASLLIDIAVSTATGSVKANGRYDVLTSSFTGEVTHADASVAQHWWPGAVGGVARGPISFRGGLIEGRLELQDGAVLHDGLSATNVNGEIRLRYPVIDAELSGLAFGGPVSARGSVNVAAQRWEATGLATAELKQAADWLARSQLPEGIPVDLSGVGDVQLQLSGWRSVEASGTVSAAGDVEGIALEDVQASFRLPADGVLRVNGAGTLGGAPLSVVLGPGASGMRTSVTASGVQLAGAGFPGVLDAVVTIEGSGSARIDAAWSGDLVGRSLNAGVEVELTDEGWSGFITGFDDTGTTFEGAAIFLGGNVQGEVTAHQLLPDVLSTGARVSVAARGRLDDLELTLTLAGPNSVTLTALGDASPDLRGSAVARLGGGSIRSLAGAFGPVAVAGDASLSPFSGRVMVSTQHLTVEPSGGVRAAFALSDGVVDFGSDGVSWTGELVLDDVTLVADEPLAVSVPALQVTGGIRDGVLEAAASSLDGRVSVAMGPQGIAAEVSDLLLASATGQATAGTQARVSGRVAMTSLDAPVDFEVTVSEGARFSGVSLASDASLSGSVLVASGDEPTRVAATGTVGDLPISLDASLSPADLTLNATLRSAESSLLEVKAVTVGPGIGVDLSGSLAVGNVLAELGLETPVDTELAVSLSGVWSGAGPTDLVGSISGQLPLGDGSTPLALDVTGRGDRLGLSVVGEAAGLPVTVLGEVALTAAGGPSIAAVAEVGPISGIALDLTGASGSGVYDVELATGSGPRVSAAVPWRLSATWADQSARLDVGEGGFDLRLQDGVLHATGSAGVNVNLGELPLLVEVGLNGPGQIRSVSDVVLTGSVLSSPDSAAQPLLWFEGPLDALAVTADVDLAWVSEAVGLSGISPSGTLLADGVVDALAGPRYHADVSLRAAPDAEATPFDLAGTASGNGGDVVVELSGDGLGLTYASGMLALSANDASLRPLLPAEFTGLVNGSLSLDAGLWGGRLDVAVEGAGATVAAGVFGLGQNLAVDLDASHDLGTVSARGTLTPTLALTGSLTALGGRLSGPVGFDQAEGLVAMVVTEPFDLEYASLPSQTVHLSWRPGTPIVLSGDGIRVEATGPDLTAEVAGSLELLGTVLGVPTTLSANIAGTVGEPRFMADVIRDGLKAEVAGDMELVTISALVESAALLEEIRLRAPSVPQLDSLLAESVVVSGSWRPADEFDATIATAVAAGPAGELGLSVAVNGVPADYSGALTLSGASGTLATVNIKGASADVNGSVDLAAVAWQRIAELLNLDIEFDGRGTVSLTSSPPGLNFDVDLSAAVSGVEVGLSGTSPGQLELSVNGQGVSARGALDVGETVSAVLVGDVRGEPLAVDLRIGSDLATGTFSAVLPGIEARGTVAGEDGSFELTSLTATLDALPAALAEFAPLDLTASGSLSPRLELVGTLSSASTGESATLRFGANDSSQALLSVGWREVEATFDPTSTTARVTGSVAVGFDQTGLSFGTQLARSGGASEASHLRVESMDLVWTPALGLNGAARFDAWVPELHRTVGIGRVEGDISTNESGKLVLAAAAGRELSLAATLPHLLQGGSADLQGVLEFALGIHGELGTLVVSGSPTLSGSLSELQVVGPLKLDGDISGAGELQYVAGTGRVELRGDNLDLSLSGAGSEWTADVRVSDYLLPDTLPQVGGASLSLRATGTAAPELFVTVTDLRLAKGASLFTGGAVLNRSVRVALQAQLDLTDLEGLGSGEAAARGVLRGPVVLTAPSPADLRNANVTAMLDAARLGYGTFGTLSGSLQVGGGLADPRVSALFVGDGNIAGAVRIDASPAKGRLSLFSDLAVAGVHTDIDLAIDNGTVSARGIARFGDAALFLSDSDSGLQLTGAGRLEGWSADVDASLGHAVVRGTLASLSDSVAGSVHIELGGSEEQSWLRGEVGALTVAGSPFGDVHLTSADAGSRIEVRGDGLSLTLDPADLAWSVAADDLRLPGQLSAELSGEGRGLAGSVRGRLSAGSGAPAVLVGTDIGLRLTLAESLTIQGSGTVLNGELSLNAIQSPQDGGWNGSLAVTGATFSGLDLTVDGMLFGNETVPNAVLATSVRDESGRLDLAGRVAVGSQGVTVDQLLSGEALNDMVRIQGRVLPITDLRVGAEPAAQHQDGIDLSGSLRLFTTGDGLKSSGRLNAGLGPVDARLEEGEGGALTLHAAVQSLGAGVAATLTGDSLTALITDTLENGVVFAGTGAAAGDVAVRFNSGLEAEFTEFVLDAAGFVLTVEGAASQGSVALAGTLQLPTDVPVATASGRLTLPWTAGLEGSNVRVSSRGELGELDVAYDADLGSLFADIDLRVPSVQEGAARAALTGGSVQGRLGYTPSTGASGTLDIQDVRLTPVGLGAITIAADVTAEGDKVEGTATIDTAGGRLSLSGDWSLTGLLGGSGSGQAGGNVELRVRTLEISAFPAVASAVPHASGAVSGVIQLRDDLLLGQLVVPELTLGEKRSEATFEITGTTERVAVAARLLGSLFSAELAAGRVSGSARLERFPLESLAESVVGPTDVSADLTGVMRFEVPFADASDAYFRLATERFLLERAGVVTSGELSLVYEDREFVVDHARFDGRGSWQATGRISADVLDFRLDALDADFTPLLGLVPPLARSGVGAQGSFSFSATGSLADPNIRLTSDGLAFAISGASFEFERADVLLEGDELTAAVDLISGAPAAGRLAVDGRARLLLDPVALREIDFRFTGSVSAPGFGVVEDIVGTVSLTPDFLPYLRASGSLGAPLTIEGTLLPFDLRAAGSGLTVSVPSLLIGRAVVDTNLRLHVAPAGLTLGGSVRAEEVLIDPAAGSSQSQASSPASSSSGASSSGGAAPRPSISATSSRSGSAGLIFDGLRITAPQRVTFDSTFAALEAALDLTLDGDLAEPRLTGSASALRGSLRFAGREFNVSSATATFNAGRGYYPDLDVAAYTDILKTSALQGARGIEFVAPEGPTLRVTLAFSGPVESAPGEGGGFRFDVRPILSSDAMIEVSDGNVISTVRSLTEAELLTLLTLGRLELNPELVGSGGLGGVVAQGALDTAVDLLIVGEIQNALREALGLDVVEIRTSAFSSLLGENAAPFSVSVRFGGYINPELFASYRIGTRDDAAFGITNEVTLSYGLGPVDIDLIGRLDFPAAGVIAAPRPELGFGVRYDINQWLSIDGGLILSTERSVVRFGLSLRW